MYCQLDQVGEILNIAGVVKDALFKDVNESIEVTPLSLKASSVIFGLLLLSNNDVFIKKGTAGFNDNQIDYYWVELYLDGLPFILTVTYEKAPEVLFLPEEEAQEEYGFQPERDHVWQPSDCEESVWQAALAVLDIHKPVQQVLGDILKIM